MIYHFDIKLTHEQNDHLVVFTSHPFLIALAVAVWVAMVVYFIRGVQRL